MRTLLPFALVLALAACGVNPDNSDGGVGGGGGSGGGSATGGGTGCDAATDLQTNPLHCGSCGHACQFANGTAECNSGVCALDRCLPGFRDLDGEPNNGCEASCTPLTVSASGSLDFNLPVIQLSGRVTQGGQLLPIATPRGTLRFELSGSKSVDVQLPSSGEATFAVKLFAGQYRVVFVKAGLTRVVHKGALSASGALDFDVSGGGTGGGGGGTTVTLTGLVTGNGAPLAGGPRGSVQFSSDAGVVATSALPSTGSAIYSVTLAPGVYDVLVDGDSACPATAVLPCQRSVRQRALSITASGNLDLDLPIVRVTGAVTVNGAVPAAASSERGRMRLVDGAGEGPSVSLGTSGPASWSTLVYAGPYDLVVSRPSCGGTGPLPCQTRKVKSAMPLTTAGVIDVDLKVLDVSGQVLANGQLLGPSPRGASRGTVTFKSNGVGTSIDLGVSSASTFQLKLYDGTYDVVVDNASDCPSGPLPCGAKKVKSITLTASGVLDVDVAVVKASGTVSVNGGPMGPAASSRGTLRFDGPSEVDVPLTASGDASWAATLHPGTYRVELDNKANCDSGPVPCQTRVLEAARAINVSESIMWHLPVIEVTGAVTLNGQPVTAGSANVRGELLFRDPSATTAPASLGTTGSATYRAKLYPATYDVLFRNTTDCAPNDAQPLPCQGEGEVEKSVALTASGLKDFNVFAVTLSGIVNVNTSQMPASATGSARAVMRFATFGSTPSSRSLSSSGAASYQVRLLPGRYDVGIENVSDCGANGALPCQKHVLAGCGAP